MANNKIQIKRTTVSGRTANTTNASNAAFIDKGELAVNLADRKIFSSDAANTLFEVGSNLTSLSVTSSVTLNNDVSLRFKTLNGNNVGFRQQSDDNFVFFTSNTAGGERPVFAIYANTLSSNLSVLVPTVFNTNVYIGALSANGSLGTNGQVLTSNGSQVYWQTVAAATGTNVNATFAWTNTHSFAANVTFGNNISLNSGNSTVGGGALLLAGIADPNWKIGRNTNSTTKWYYTNNSLDIMAANTNLEGIVLGNPLAGGRSYLETGHDGTYIASNVTIGNTSSKSTINSTAFSGTANNSTNFGGLSLATVQGQITSNAATAYSNGVSYTDTKIGTANTAMVANAAAAYTNAVSYTDTKIGTANTAMAANAAAAYTNAVSYTDTKIGTANTAMVANAAAAYTNATVFAANASNANNGTLAEARLPYRMNQNVRTIDNVEFVNVTVTGNITVSGTSSVIGGNNLSITDNMIYMNQGVYGTITNISGNGSVVTFTANNNYAAGWDVFVSGVNPSSYNGTYLNILAANATHFQVSNTNTASYVSGGNVRGKSEQNPDLGIAFGYNDGSYHHGGFFRDASDGIFKVFDNYDPEPDTSVYIDTANNSFHLANFQANVIYVGNTTVYSTINTTSFTGTANNSTNFGGLSLATVQGQITSNAATAYSNSVSYTDTKIGTANTAMAANAATAYSNAVSYTDTKIGTANTAMAANAATAYSNAVSYTDTKIGTANTAMAANAATAYSNAVSYTDTKIGTANTAMAANAATAYSNAVSYTDTKIGTANTAMVANAAAAYSNAVTYADNKSANAYSNAIAIAANATNLTSGTVDSARLPSGNSSVAGAVIIVNSVSNTSVTAVATANNVKTAYDAAITANTNAQTALTAAGAAYTNAVSYTDTKIGTANTAMVANAAAAYTNAIAIAANASNITSGTVAFARLSPLYLGTTTIQSSSAAQAVSGITTLATGNTTITGFANVTSTLAAGNTTIAGFINVNRGISLANSTSNIIDFAAAGVNAPTTTTLSSGTKLLLYPALSSTQSDYAIGIDASTLWNSVPVANTTFKFKWYGANTEVAFLDGAGNFKTSGYANVGTTLQVGTNTATFGTAAYIVSNGNVGIGTSSPGNKLVVNGTASVADLVVSGNLTVSGTRTYVNTTTLDVGDNIITLNADLGASAPSENAGIEIMRGTSANVQFIWDETNDRWSTNAQPLAVSSLIPSANIVLGSAGLSANGALGTAGQVLHSNGTATYWAADDGITSIATANGLTGGTITSTGTLGVASGSTLTVNSTGIHVNSALAITSLALSGGLSGVTTAAMGNTTITGFANVTSTLQVGGVSTFSGNVVLGSSGVSANGSFGTSGQLLTSNGTSVYWANASSGVNAVQSTYTYTLAANTTLIQGIDDNAAILSYTTGLESVFINGVRQIPVVDYTTTNATAITLTSNAIAGEVVQITTWVGQVNTTNVNATFAWTNTHSFSNTVTFGAISANGSLGTAGQVLHSNGSATYWAADDNSGTVTSITTSNGISGGTITSTGTIGVTTGSTLSVNSTGIHVNSALALTSLALTGGFTANGALGTVGQVLHSNGTATYWAADDGITSIATANGLSGGTITSTGTLGVTTGSTLTVNTTGIHVNSALSITSLALSGALSGVTTAAVGNTTITGFANVTSTLQVGNNIFLGGGGDLIISSATGGANSAIYNDAADLFFNANGATRQYIASNGNIGIGTTTPGYRLDVASSDTTAALGYAFRIRANATAAAGAIQFTDSGASSQWGYLAANSTSVTLDCSSAGSTIFRTNGSERMRIDSSGNVGIGTSSPTYKLEVYGSPAWIRNFAGAPSSPTETQDWPVSAFNIASYGDFTLQTMLAFTLPNDGNYFTGYDAWNFKLAQTANSTTSAGVSGMQFGGPGYLAFMPGGSEKFRIASTGAITSASLADAVGYKGLPQNQQTSAYTLVLADMGKHIYATAGSFGVTIPANSTTAFPIGAAITIVVEDASHTVVPAAGVTLVLAGTGAATTGTRTLAQGAVATLLKVGTDRWYISGAGVT